MIDIKDSALPPLPLPAAYAAGLDCNMRGFINVTARQQDEFSTPLFTEADMRQAQTGCQYLSYRSSITPRRDKEGNHVGCR